MKEPKLSQLARPVVQIAITHVAIWENRMSSRYMFLQNWHNVRHRLIPDWVYKSNLSLPAKHAKHPPDRDVITQALKPLMVHFWLINLHNSWENQVRHDFLLSIMRVSFPEQVEILGTAPGQRPSSLVEHPCRGDCACIHHPKRQCSVELAHVHIRDDGWFLDRNRLEAEGAFPDEAVLYWFLVAEGHRVHDAEGTLTLAVDKPVHAHRVKHLNVGLEEYWLHSLNL